MKGLSSVLAVGAAVWLGACGAPAPDPIEASRAPIFGGQLATTCQWPTTVLLSGCTGTLVHPLIVTSAAHCGTGAKTVTFGETQGSPRKVAVEYCRVFQKGNNAPDGTDWGFCKLKTPVTDVPIVPILMGCETSILKAGQKVVVAGFGDSTDRNTGYGTKRWVETTLNRADRGDGTVQVGGMGKAPCFGDSGGPAYVRLADGSWRVFGIDSSGTGKSCGAGDIMALIYKAASWIEKESGIDITPCHDADGTWNPSAACRGFSLTPDAPGRTWDNGCAEATLSPPVTTCGALGDGGAGNADGGSTDAARADGSLRDSGGADATPSLPADGGEGASDAASSPPPIDASLPRQHDAGGPRPHDAALAVDAEPTATPPDETEGVHHSAQASGCGCRIGGRDQPEPAPALVLAALAALVGACVRSRRPRG